MNVLLPNLEFAFGWLLAASWQASVLAVAVIAVQRIFGARLNPRWRYALWLLVVLRLVLPVVPESALSLFQFAPPPPAALTVSVTEPLFIAAPDLPPVDVVAAQARPEHPLSVYSLLAIIWLAGALGLSLLTLVVNLRFARQVANSPEVTDPELLRFFADAKKEFQVRRPIRLIENSQVQSPAIMGLFAPTLLLPVDVRAKFDARELRFIFLHELAHLKRGDVLIQALIALLQILHWFNPVLWLAFRRMRIDREPATDALVLSRTGEDEKERYGLMLIKLLEHFNQRHSLATLVGILEDKDQFKRRFGLIARFTRGAYGWSLLGVVILGALAIAGLTQAQRAAFKRDPSLPLVINLKPWYFRVFADPAGSDSAYKGYAGMKTVDGLPFAIGGQVELWGQETAARGKVFPEKIEGIRIDRKFDELHLVHAADWRDYYGSPVAKIRLNYADGTNALLTIRYNQQVNDRSRLFTEDAEIIDDPGTKIIWRGPGGAEGTGRLFKSVLENPFPGKMVDTMDLLSTGSNCGYMLVAATVAQREPGRAVTPPLPFLPARNFLGQLKVHVVDKKTGAPIAGAEIYPVMDTGDICLVADSLVTADDGTAAVKYPTGGETIAPGSGDASDPKYPRKGASDLRLKVTRAGYNDCEIHWNNGWDAGEIPQEITYRLTPVGATDLTNPDFTVTGSAHPTALAAVRQGDATGLQKLIDGGADLPKVDAKGEPLIFSAGSPEVAEILLKHGADANVRNSQKDALINYFCRNGGKQAAGLVGILLAHGADPNSRDGELGETPLMDAEDAATVEVLMAHGADIRAKMSNGMPTLSEAGNKTPDYLDALIRHGTPFDLKTDGPTVLVHAAWGSNLALMKALLERGVDPNLQGVWYIQNGEPDLMRPLESAVIDGQFKPAKLLLEHGAKADNDIMVAALHNRRTEMIKLFWDSGARSISELCYAVSQNQPIADLQKLLDGGIPADPPEDLKFSPLALAAELGNLEAVKLLVSRGADVNKAPIFNPKFPIYKMSALMMAASEGRDEIVSYLLAHGAKPDVGALWDAADNSTPYGEQQPKEHFEKCVRLLLDADALKGATPEEQGYVLSAGLGTRQGPANPTVLKMLLDAGISPEVPMPYIVENGEKPKSVIGYYRDWYQKKKDDPTYSSQAATMKPLVDMLEAAEKHASTQAEPAVVAMPAAMTNAMAYTQPVAVDTAPGTHPELDQQLVGILSDGRTDKVGAGDVDEVRELLRQGASANAKDARGTSALTWALNFGKDEAAQALIKAGADVRAQDSGGLNAAWPAAEIYYCPGALDLMIKGGLDVRATTKEGRSILMSMMSAGVAQPGKTNYLPDRVWTDDEYKAYVARERRTAELLIAAGVDFNGKDGTRTPLIQAVQGGHEAVVRVLLEHGANTSFKDPDGHTALDAAELFHPEFVPLLSGGGNPGAGKTEVGEAKGGDAQASGQVKDIVPAPAPNSDERRGSVSGVLTILPAAHGDLAKSFGALVSDDNGREYPLNFDQKGAFSVSNIQPGKYHEEVHLVCQPRDTEITVDKTFGFTIVTPGSHQEVSLAWDAIPPARGNIEIGLKIVQIDEEVYLANKKQIDAGVEKGSAGIIELLNNLKGVSLLSAPSVTTVPGLRANVDILREMPYPTGFAAPKLAPVGSAPSPAGATNLTAYIPPTPTDFETKNVGISAEITPALIGKTLSPQGAEIPGRIMLTGKFSVAEFEGFTQSNMAVTDTPTFNTSESHFAEALNDGEMKGVWIPGSHFRSADSLNRLPGVKADPNEPTVETRYLLFLSAREVD